MRLCEFIRIGKSSYLVCKNCDQIYRSSAKPETVYRLCELFSGHCESPLGPRLSASDILLGSQALDCTLSVSDSPLSEFNGEWSTQLGLACREGITFYATIGAAGVLVMAETATGAAIWLTDRGDDSSVLRCTDATGLLSRLIGSRIKIVNASGDTQRSSESDNCCCGVGAECGRLRSVEV